MIGLSGELATSEVVGPQSRLASKISIRSLIVDILFTTGMIAAIFQEVQIGIAQPIHIWMLIVLMVIITSGGISLKKREMAVFFAFVGMSIFITLVSDYGRIKALDQVIKFLIIYPGLYIVGRWFGNIYSHRKTPIGLKFLLLVICFELFVEQYSIPYIYVDKSLYFAGLLHGTFKEPTWLAEYIFLVSYFLFETSRLHQRNPSFGNLWFVSLNLLSMLLTKSKTVIVACGIVFMLRSKINIFVKLISSSCVIMVYLSFFSSQFSQEALSEKYEHERGLAFSTALDIIYNNPIGHGFGFVEYYFSNPSISILGLGEGVNAIFCTPLDLIIIAGPLGFLAWLVFFGGVGLGAETVLLPIAALSLLAPLHQGEIVYLAAGALVSSVIVDNQKRSQALLPEEAVE